jgi:hypothetical protein
LFKKLAFEKYFIKKIKKKISNSNYYNGKSFFYNNERTDRDHNGRFKKQN